MNALILLGGNPTRSETAFKEVQNIQGFPEVLVIFSTVDNPIECFTEARKLGIQSINMFFDFRAWDTITHFIPIIDMLIRHKVTTLYVVTGESHLNPRSLWIAKIVFAGYGIKIIGIPHTEAYKDPVSRIVVDIVRTLIWKVTGILLYNPWIRKRRTASIKELQYTYELMIKPLLTKV